MIGAHHGTPAVPDSGDGLMVDIVPPATSRDRWMYEQGRLAERRVSTPPAASGSAEPDFQAAFDAFQNTAIDLLADDDEERMKCVRAAVIAAHSSAPPSQQDILKAVADKLDEAIRCPREDVDRLVAEALELIDGDRLPANVSAPIERTIGEIPMVAASVSAKDADAWMTRNDDGDPAMLFFDKQEAMQYTDGEEPEALILRDGITPAASKGAA